MSLPLRGNSLGAETPIHKEQACLQDGSGLDSAGRLEQLPIGLVLAHLLVQRRESFFQRALGGLLPEVVRRFLLLLIEQVRGTARTGASDINSWPDSLFNKLSWL